MNYQRLRKEIDLSFSIAQTYLNYKRGDISFDAFVMDAMEQSEESLIKSDEGMVRSYFEGLQDKPGDGSNSGLASLLSYDSIFDAMDFDVESETEADMIWSTGSRYFDQKQLTLVK
tara:strand:- start:56 stop:403 length:348 start_codon:yes stop_codon:yes gene_type:complete